ncbi:S-methyl-5-thioribose-1-phosphate isomerase [Streptomyces sp. NPDC059740]|uniref:S-methyl-5-thioribose-1-phosphate isomerase n=1 Tax=Streptomyces sp. NPDC059740 TaxID=3346926 RepID=UPI0036525FEE
MSAPLSATPHDAPSPDGTAVPGRDASATAPAAPSPPSDTSLYWDDGAVVVIDQRLLPHTVRTLRLTTVEEVVAAVRSLAVRGAPAIGLAGALGVALSARAHRLPGGAVAEAAVRADAARIAAARPTAVNLSWAVDRVLRRLPEGHEAVLAEATSMLTQDRETNRRAVERAADLVTALAGDRPLRLLTHCNTGRLATAAVGTALGTVLELAARGRVAEVLVDETRPLLQGSRLTAWELGEAGVDYRLCVDSAAAAAMSRGLVDCVLVGADRIAANGDTANKIGTYALAVAAARHGIPFVVVAPESSWDRTLADGTGIRVEERAPEEVLDHAGVRTGPSGARVFNPAFDVTPAELITALVSEEQTFRPGGAGPAPADTSAHSGTAATPSPAAPSSLLARTLAALSRRLYERGWMPGTSGNLSVRLPERPDHALITASGRDKGELTEKDTVLVEADTGRRVTPGPLRASAETAIHAALYRAAGAGAVVHVHSPYATAVACRAADRGLQRLTLRHFELLKGLSLDDPARTVLPVFANHRDVGRIAEEVAAYLARTPDAPPGLLIADHGITAWGADPAQARNHLECLESICELLLLGARPSVWDQAPAPTGEDD